MIILGNSRLYLGGKLLAVANKLSFTILHIKKEDGVRGFVTNSFILDELISTTDIVKNNKHYRYNDQDWKGKGKIRKRRDK